VGRLPLLLSVSSQGLRIVFAQSMMSLACTSPSLRVVVGRRPTRRVRTVIPVVAAASRESPASSPSQAWLPDEGGFACGGRSQNATQPPPPSRVRHTACAVCRHRRRQSDVHGCVDLRDADAGRGRPGLRWLLDGPGRRNTLRLGAITLGLSVFGEVAASSPAVAEDATPATLTSPTGVRYQVIKEGAGNEAQARMANP